MMPEDYIKEAVKTENKDFNAIMDRLNSVDTIRLLHASMGLGTECGEIMDALKKHLIYGKPLDHVNLKEEIGDLFWYIALICDAYRLDPLEICQRNMEKLRTRYPEKFDECNALNRDLEKERQILEK